MNSDIHFERILSDRIATAMQAANVPGYVAGVYHQGRRFEVATGVANLNTGAGMTTNTRWLLGSITKVMVATLVLRYVADGKVDLNAKISRYLPDFRLAQAGAAEQITVRQALNHTNGIDADSLMPPGSVRSYVDALAQCGTLFAAGERLHYSNPGFSLAARILEVVGGQPFNDLLESELFAPLGMFQSCTSPAQAILHRTAIGAFADPATGELRATTNFMLPASGAGAGSTPMVTVGDLLAFGLTHLHGGVAPNGQRFLPADLIRLMQTATFDMERLDIPPIGLGWWLVPIAGTTALWHGGGSPGGQSNLVVFPELDLVIAGYGNGASALVHDAVIQTALQELTGWDVKLPFEVEDGPIDIAAHVGHYEAFQTRMQVDASDALLRLTTEFRPFDDAHARVAAGYLGGVPSPFTIELTPIRRNLFVPTGVPLEICAGIWGRTALVSFDSATGDGHSRFIHQRLLSARRVDA